MITLGETEARTGVDASLEAGATISGHVTDSVTPANNLAGSCVTAESATFSPEPSLGSSGFAQTDANGEYKITRLRAGGYKVKFTPCVGGPPPSPPPPNVNAEWYDGASDANSAQTINLTTGQVRDDIDASMSAGGTISGRVTDSATPGNNLQGICVGVLAASGGGMTIVANTNTNASGNYTFNGLAAGSYKVGFSPCGQNYVGEYYNGVSDFASGETINLGAGQSRTGIDASLEPGATISGHVTDSSTPANNLGNICVSVNSTLGGSRGARRPTRAATTPWSACAPAATGSSSRPAAAATT